MVLADDSSREGREVEMDFLLGGLCLVTKKVSVSFSLFIQIIILYIGCASDKKQNIIIYWEQFFSEWSKRGEHRTFILPAEEFTLNLCNWRIGGNRFTIDILSVAESHREGGRWNTLFKSRWEFSLWKVGSRICDTVGKRNFWPPRGLVCLESRRGKAWDCLSTCVNSQFWPLWIFQPSHLCWFLRTQSRFRLFFVWVPPEPEASNLI